MLHVEHVRIRGRTWITVTDNTTAHVRKGIVNGKRYNVVPSEHDREGRRTVPFIHTRSRVVFVVAYWFFVRDSGVFLLLKPMIDRTSILVLVSLIFQMLSSRIPLTFALLSDFFLAVA
jgi:hypothetical protein